ncbi:unnamed protein product [Lupinus luteus]|uniref:Uncharacterized protein n=1 Tax=Lupinus luteus TaxID=3873 RepID=A0AAV1W876_LUPLU
MEEKTLSSFDFDFDDENNNKTDDNYSDAKSNTNVKFSDPTNCELFVDDIYPYLCIMEKRHHLHGETMMENIVIKSNEHVKITYDPPVNFRKMCV